MVDKVSAFIFDCDGAHSAAERLNKWLPRAHLPVLHFMFPFLLLEFCPGTFSEAFLAQAGLSLWNCSVQALSGAATP